MHYWFIDLCQLFIVKICRLLSVFQFFVNLKIFWTKNYYMANNNRIELKIFKSYWFILALIILLLNDFLFKKTFSNIFTGKISDISGLFVFSLFWIALFPKLRIHVLIFVALGFIWWKSPLSQFLIDFWNSNSFFQISRVVDYTDYIALLVLPFSNFIFKKKKFTYYLSLPPFVPIVVSVFAFCATSYVKKFDFNVSYEFKMSKLELIEKINNISLLDSNKFNLPLSPYIENSNYSIPINEKDSSFYHVSSFTNYSDTIFKTNSKGKEIETINNYKIPNKDTMYVSSKGNFEYNTEVGKYFKEINSNYCERLSFFLKIFEKDNKVVLRIIKVSVHNCNGVFDKNKEETEKERLIYSFEKEVVEKIGAFQKIKS